MKLLSQKYEHRSGVKFKIRFVEVQSNEADPLGSSPLLVTIKKVRVDSEAGKGKFMFDMSRPDVIIKMGQVLQEIGEFCKKL